jgi:hypothetical protein
MTYLVVQNKYATHWVRFMRITPDSLINLADARAADFIEKIR